MFKDRNIQIYVVGNANSFYLWLQQKVRLETQQGKPSTPWQTLFRLLEFKIAEIKKNPFFGIQIPKKLHPAKYVNLYEAKNLWKLNLPLGWRAIYFIDGDIENVTASIIDILSHEDYEKIFGYRNR